MAPGTPLAAECGAARPRSARVVYGIAILPDLTNVISPHGCDRIASETQASVCLHLTTPRVPRCPTRRRGGMADAEDLKSSGRERPCGFESHRRHWTCDDPRETLP